jgi:hypothetical protein
VLGTEGRRFHGVGIATVAEARRALPDHNIVPGMGTIGKAVKAHARRKTEHAVKAFDHQLVPPNQVPTTPADSGRRAMCRKCLEIGERRRNKQAFSLGKPSFWRCQESRLKCGRIKGSHQ